MARSGKLRQLECAVCAGDAGKHHQHWNQDTGYGICARCVAWLRSRGESEQAIQENYGVAGVNYAAPADTDTAADEGEAL